MDEAAEIKFNSIIGNKEIDQEWWALSIVRKFNADHAYLIMEGINEDNERIMMHAHLFIKENSNNKKATVVFQDISKSLEELNEIGQSCSCYTWPINRFQADAFVSLVQSEQERANQNKINYIFYGKSKISGSFASLADDAKASLETYSNTHCTDALLRDGHNCGSWAIAMVLALQLSFQGNYMPFIAFDPKAIIQGQHDGDKESSQGCRIR